MSRYYPDVFVPGPNLPGAACANPIHRKLWQASRSDHFATTDMAGAGEKATCGCHSPHTQTTLPTWDSYWWDTNSPDRDYALLVCRTCPVMEQCNLSRPAGHLGVWGGRSHVQRIKDRPQSRRAYMNRCTTSERGAADR